MIFRLLVSLLLGRFHADDSSLAKDLAVFLTRNLFGHFEHHFDQCVFGKALPGGQKHSRLAEVLNCALIPCSKILHAISHRGIKLDAARAGYPRYLMNVLASLLRRGTFGSFLADALSTTHSCPVVLIFCGAQQTHLVKLPVRVTPRPGKFVGTTAQEENVQQLLRHGSKLCRQSVPT